MRKVSKAKVYDTLHRGSVTALLGLTLFGSSLLIYRTYKYFTVTRPLQLEHKMLLAQEQITQEQLEREAELLRRQREAETIKA